MVSTPNRGAWFDGDEGRARAAFAPEPPCGSHDRDRWHTEDDDDWGLGGQAGHRYRDRRHTIPVALRTSSTGCSARSPVI